MITASAHCEVCSADLEFQTAANPLLANMGDQLVDTVVELATELLQREHQLRLQRDWVVELDSTTATKFSRHLIVRCALRADTNHHPGACAAGGGVGPSLRS